MRKRVTGPHKFSAVRRSGMQVSPRVHIGASLDRSGSVTDREILDGTRCVLKPGYRRLAHALQYLVGT
jgi:hypothetical protein